MISFQPNSIQEFSIQPKVYISQINYNDPDHNFLHQEAITFKKGITLEHNQSTFYIDYTSLSYQAPNLTQYAYCMRVKFQMVSCGGREPGLFHKTTAR